MINKKVKNNMILEQFLKKFSVLNDTGYKEYDLYMDLGRYRVEIKHNDTMLYFMEYNQETNSISSNEIQDTKMYKLLKNFIRDYYNLGRI